MRFNKPDKNYWDAKFAAYMHDPIDKVFQIPGHEKRAAETLEVFGLQMPNEKFWKKADAIASGFERGQVPSFSNDPSKNGAVDFLKNPIITHPTSEKSPLRLSIPHCKDTGDAKRIHNDLMDFIKKNVGMQPGEGGYSDEFKNQPERFAYARFLYTHLALRFKLAEDNAAGIGALWHRLPADSRFPDHTIWQHNSLTSSLYSCMELARNDQQVGIMVVSITPVQQFIARARRLRDYWTGSVLLSWLCFEGIRWVMEYLGPDHILYPSLIDQPLVNEYLTTNGKVSNISSLNQRRDIASLPNKFLFLIPTNDAEAIGADIADQIKNAWRNLYLLVEKQVSEIFKDENAYIHEIFKRQNQNFWDIQWAAVKLLDTGDRQELEQLLPKSRFESQFGILHVFRDLIKAARNFEMDGRGILYPVTHSLVQTVLAARKTGKKITRPPENGEKCHLCGEFEVMHAKKYDGTQSASDYDRNIKQFWKKLKNNWMSEYDFRENERLCSVCLIKRIAYKALEREKGNILSSSFKNAEGFPSTTEMALSNYFKRKGIVDRSEKREIADKVHNEPDDKTANRDRYYAILLMDGDHMGKLVNGETLASTWESVMHPDIVARLENPEFDEKYRSAWKEIYNKHRKRLLTPSIHAAISESLGDFAVNGVTAIVNKFKGKLIYAGGDDVCAVLPVDTVLEAAEEIQQYYVSEFKLIKDEESRDVGPDWQIEAGKLSLSLGKGSDISISAGILICHHKENLAHMIAETHRLLDQKAKADAGRNACAIELRKRSGGSRYFTRKWDNRDNRDNNVWESFRKVGDLISNKNKQQVSTSLVYRLGCFQDGIEAILKKVDHKKLLAKFIKKQLDRSVTGEPKNGQDLPAKLAEKIADIVVCPGQDGKPTYEPAGLIVAAFIADKGVNDELV